MIALSTAFSASNDVQALLQLDPTVVSSNVVARAIALGAGLSYVSTVTSPLLLRHRMRGRRKAASAFV